MSLPDKIWAHGEFAGRDDVDTGDWTAYCSAEHPAYLRLDGPTLATVREALTLARRVVASKHEHKLLSDALDLLRKR